MGELTDRAKGMTNEAVGNTKQAAGKATDNHDLHAKGVAQERKGEAQQVKGKVKGALGDKVCWECFAPGHTPHRGPRTTPPAGQKLRPTARHSLRAELHMTRRPSRCEVLRHAPCCARPAAHVRAHPHWQSQ